MFGSLVCYSYTRALPFFFLLIKLLLFIEKKKPSIIHNGGFIFLFLMHKMIDILKNLIS